MNSNGCLAAPWQTIITKTPIVLAASNDVSLASGWQSGVVTGVCQMVWPTLSPTNAGCTIRQDFVVGTNSFTVGPTNLIIMGAAYFTNAGESRCLYDWDVSQQAWKVYTLP